jgi:hypothetical protein
MLIPRASLRIERLPSKRVVVYIHLGIDFKALWPIAEINSNVREAQPVMGNRASIPLLLLALEPIILASFRKIAFALTERPPGFYAFIPISRQIKRAAGGKLNAAGAPASKAQIENCAEARHSYRSINRPAATRHRRG